MTIAFAHLDESHRRDGFSCGEPALDDWFRRRAGQDEKRNIARVFVANDAAGLVGFYSLASFTINAADLPEDLARRLPRYEAIPAALIGRLARDRRVRGQGVGALLVADAIQRILDAGESVATFAILVDAKTPAAAGFYRGLGFQPFASRPSRLFLPTATALGALEKL